MTDLNANALEQDADDDADVVDSWMLYLRDASFLGHCSAASASALHRVLGARVHEYYFVTGGTKVRRYMEEINQEFRPSTYLLTYIPSTYYYLFFTYFLLIFYLLINMSLD